MAIYTETFAEWLTGGGSLPPEFGQIDGFGDIFTGHFCDREIGFETEKLFEIKLNTRAVVVVPVYKNKIDALTAALAAVQNPTKTNETVFAEGKKTAKTWELPINGDINTVTPSGVGTTESDNDTTTVKTTGATVDESVRVAEFAERETVVIMDRLLREFDDLFMMVY